MNQQEILSLDLNGQNILIIGRPTSGKTFLSNKLKEKGHYVIHTDDFIDQSNHENNQIFWLLEEHDYCNPSCIEGMLGFKVLLYGEMDGSYKPDVIIFCEISAGKQREIYLAERDASKLQHQKRFWTKCLSLYQEWEKIVQNKPQIITYERDIV